MSGEATEIPTAVVTTQAPVRKEAGAEKKSLVINPEAKGQMRELDRFVADREIVAETFGWGLTVTDNSNSERVVEFVVPDPDKVFVMDSLSLSQDQSRLMELLAGAKSLQLRVDKEGVALVPDSSEDHEEWLRFPANQEAVQWGMSKSNLEELVGFELPDNMSELQTEIRRRQEEVGQPSTDRLPVRTDWELVLSGGSAIITEKFSERVNKLAQERKAKINFTMHHHPNLGLAVWALKEKD